MRRELSSMFSLFFFVTFIFFVDAQWDNDWDSECTTPDHQIGECLPIYSCKSMLALLDQLPQPFPKEIQNHLKKYICGFENRAPKVCCPSTPIYFEISNSNQQESTFPDVSRHRNINLLPQNCGVLDTADKIVNGNKTRLFEFPWMVLLSYRTRFGPQFKCGGTIINYRYILTAAHCLVNLKTPIIGVRIGEHDVRTETDCELNDFGEEECAPPYQDLQIEKIITHKDYNSQKFTNDIAMLRVAPIDFSQENTKPVCLPLEETKNYNFTNRNVIVTGWGITETGRSSPQLLKVALPHVPLEKCQKLYKKIAEIDERQLCAGGKDNRDSCSGDSGGPLHTMGNLFEDTRYVQQGIVSFGPRNCGGATIPGVYTRVAAFMDWILDNMEP